MKIKKLSFLSLFLIIGLLLFIPNAVNAADEVIIDFKDAVPVVGEGPKYITIDSDKCEIEEQGWYEYEEGKATDEVTKFESDTLYYFSMHIKAKEGYTIDEILISIENNITWDNAHKMQRTSDGGLSISGFYTTGTVHDDIEIEGTANIIPVIGGTPQYLNIPSKEYEIYYEEWLDDTNNPVSTFEAGEEYQYVLGLKHKSAFGWDGSSTLNISNIDWIYTMTGPKMSNGTLWFKGVISPVEGFEITIESDEGVMLGQDGPLVGFKGYNRKLHIPAEEGYKITSVKVNGVEQTLPLANDNLSLNNIQEDINVVIETEKVEIEDNESSTGEVPALKQINLIENSINQEFSKGTDEFLAFTLINNGGYGKVFIDGIELNEDNGDYSWLYAENLPHIRISKTYLTTLKSGKHTIKIVIDNVGEAETTFTIVEPEDKENNNDDNKGNVPSDDNNNTNNGNANTEESNSNNPQTGDNIMLFVAILGIATIGIVVTTRLKKIKK